VTANETRVGEKRPGGRAARVRADVLAAASDLLLEVGYDRMSVEDVAARAGVHKTTVYRRWPSKSELVFDAVSEQSARAVPIPDSGSLVEDLRILAKQVVANIGSEAGGRRSRSIVAAATSSDEVAKAMASFWSERLELSSAIVERAVERGDLPADVDSNLIIEALIGPLWLRLLLTGEPITDDLAEQMASLVAAGAGGLSTRS
jgi:AcrR family transcriptional regulator